MPLTYGPTNPHPLSQLKTELVWEGKYDEYGRRREVDIAGAAMPLQKIETIDEPRSRALVQGKLWDDTTAHRDDFRNMLIWGDNKLVMASLLKEFKGKIDLFYIDPPFDVGADFTMGVPLGDERETLAKDQSMLEMVAYRDMWGRGTDSYLHMMYERLNLMKDFLSEKGSIFVHVGANISHYVKALMDDCFGNNNFRNEIILPGRASKNLQQQFDTVQRLNVRHDILLWYTKSEGTRFKLFWVSKHDTGNPEGHWHHFWSNADRPTMRYQLFGITPTSGQWIWREERALQAYANYERYLEEGGGRTLAQYWRDTGAVLEFVRPAPDDGKPQYWRAPAEYRVADTVWSGLPIYSTDHNYPTEKNSALLAQVFELASQEGDLVADFFCGSGTTGTVAERLGRRWILCDLGRFAIHTTRKRMIELQRTLHAEHKPYRSFDVYNLGRYERQWWQKERLKGADEEHRKVVLEFYRAEILTQDRKSVV
jgi:adenine-specific DNA-methyltransferase